MMLLNSEFREFYIKSSEKSQKAHKVAYGRGGVPGLITGRSALEAMGFDLSVNHPPLEVTVKEVKQPPSSEKVEYRPGDIILIAEIPQGYFTTDPKPEAKPEAKAKRRGK